MAMAAWSSKGRSFEYACGFSIDEAIIPIYGFRNAPAGRVYLVVEVRTNFYVKVSRTEEKTWLGSERFGASSSSVNYLRLGLAARLSDYWLSPPQIKELLDKAVNWLSAGPTVLDLEVCSLREEGEPLDAMRPGTLRPLDLTPSHMLVHPNPRPEEIFKLRLKHVPVPPDYEGMTEKSNNMDMVWFLECTLYEKGVRVDDAEEGITVMQQCGICSGRPFVGTVIAKLRCGHQFHYHCIVWALKDERACPICRHPPYDLSPKPPRGGGSYIIVFEDD